MLCQTWWNDSMKRNRIVVFTISPLNQNGVGKLNSVRLKIKSEIETTISFCSIQQKELQSISRYAETVDTHREIFSKSY